MSEMWEDVGATFVEDESTGSGWIDLVDGTLPAEGGEDCGGIVLQPDQYVEDVTDGPWVEVPEWLTDPSTDIDPDGVYN